MPFLFIIIQKFVMSKKLRRVLCDLIIGAVAVQTSTFLLNTKLDRKIQISAFQLYRFHTVKTRKLWKRKTASK